MYDRQTEIYSITKRLTKYYPAGQKVYWNLNFVISLIANLRNLNSAYRYIFRNLSMIAYMI